MPVDLDAPVDAILTDCKPFERTRMRNLLVASNIKTVRQLVSNSRAELLRVRYFGHKMLALIERCLRKHGLKLKS